MIIILIFLDITFEEEEPVVEAVSNELKSLEGEIADTDKTISDFCNELNIKALFNMNVIQENKLILKALKMIMEIIIQIGKKSIGDLGETFNGLTGKTKEDFGIGKPYIQYMQIFNSAKINVSRINSNETTA